MVERIPLKNSLFTHQELLTRVQLWIDSLNMARFLNQQQFKFFPFFVNTLPSPFLHAALLYSIEKRLVGLVKSNERELVELNRVLKEGYNELNMTLLERRDSYFYFLCVYLTKLAGSFLAATFLDLEVDGHLQAELFITLVHVMLGVQVCPKTYHINLKKIVRERSLPRHFTISKCDSIQSFPQEKPSQVKINLLAPPNKRLLTKKTIQRKCTQEPSHYYEPSQIEQFRQTLKQNLAVQVLPRLPPKRIKASEFDHQTELAEAVKEGDEKKYLFTTRESSLPKSPSDHLVCTQNSSSFKMLLAKNNLSCKAVHRAVKISHRPQLVPRKRVTLNPAVNNVRQDQEQTELLTKTDNSRKDWEVIIKDLKQHVKANSKHSMFRTYFDTAADTPEVPSEYSQDEKEERRGELQKEVPKKVKEEEQGKKQEIERKVKHFMYWINQQQGSNFHETKKECFPDSHQFRKLKKKFEGECSVREEETKYSMFNLNSTFSFFRSLLH